MVKNSLLITLLFLFTFTLIISAGAQAPTFEQPAVVTTCGQSPAALMVKMICQQVGVECTQKDLLTGEELKESDYQTLIITMGTSSKGMGAAGTNMNQEEARIDKLIEVAEEKGIQILGAHVEGMSRRVDSNDEKSIEIVMPNSDALIIKNASNEDNFFTEKSEELNIPVEYFDKNMEMGNAVEKLFDVK